MLTLKETYGLVSASAAATGTTLIPRSSDGFRHLCLVTITVAGTVWLEASVTPVAPGVARWVPISGTITQTDSIAAEGNFSNLRVAWSGNTGTITVDLIQSAYAPRIY